MYAQVKKPKDNKSRVVANAVTQKKNNGKQGAGFVDNRSESIVQRKLQGRISNSSLIMSLNSTQEIDNDPSQAKQLRADENLITQLVRIEYSGELSDFTPGVGISNGKGTMSQNTFGYNIHATLDSFDAPKKGMKSVSSFHISIYDPKNKVGLLKWKWNAQNDKFVFHKYEDMGLIGIRLKSEVAIKIQEKVEKIIRGITPKLCKLPTTVESPVKISFNIEPEPATPSKADEDATPPSSGFGGSMTNTPYVDHKPKINDDEQGF